MENAAVLPKIINLDKESDIGGSVNYSYVGLDTT